MTDDKKSAGIVRRDFLKTTGAAALGLGVTGFPAVLRAQPAPVKVGLIHPVSGFIALTVAAVPTGMKAGVRISPRCISIYPVRAAPSVAWMEKEKRSAMVRNRKSMSRGCAYRYSLFRAEGCCHIRPDRTGANASDR